MVLVLGLWLLNSGPLSLGLQGPCGDPLELKFPQGSPQGHSIGDASQFRVKGRNIYVDFWLAEFEDKYIEESDLLRSTTLCMFKSIYGENEAPADATRIEKPWVRPEAYAGGSRMSEFEEKIWKDFWTIANDSTKSKELGIRANHGQAVYVKAEEGKTYQIELRASDGLSFKTITTATDEPQG